MKIKLQNAIIYFFCAIDITQNWTRMHIAVEVSWLNAIKWNGDTLFQLANTMCTLHWLEYAECIKLQFYFWYDLRLTWDQQGNGSSYVLFLIILPRRSEVFLPTATIYSKYKNYPLATRALETIFHLSWAKLMGTLSLHSLLCEMQYDKLDHSVVV